MHQIENSFLRLKAREYGAELVSIYDRRNNLERLWQADPSYWGWHAPVLFPVVGRCLNDEIKVDSRTYPMQKHGFARKSDFKLMDLSDNQVVFSLSSSHETLISFPYKFEFLISYRLDAHQLVVSYEVINKDEKPIYFSIGGHPAFAAPLKENEQYEDYFIEFEEEENCARHCINGDGFFDGRIKPTLNQSRMIALRKDLFKDDALIFKNLKSRKVSLKSINHPHYIKMDFSGFSYFGIWAKQNAHYVCLEPWIGCADTENNMADFRTKEGIVSLEPKKRFIVDYKIEVG